MGLFSGLFGAAGDAAQAAGDAMESKAYGQAATYAGQNAVIAQEAGDIKLEQTNRAVFKTLGAQQADYAGAGLTGSGSAQSVTNGSRSMNPFGNPELDITPPLGWSGPMNV